MVTKKIFFVKIAVYPGSFDPLTNGHLDVIIRASKLFDRLLVSVISNPNKHPLFTLPERLDILKKILKPISNVAVDSFSGLLVDYMEANRASIIVKGLRAVSDFEYEFQMALTNRKLAPTVETIFLMPNESYAYLSSRLIKEVAFLSGDVGAFVPPVVVEALKRKFNP